VAFGKTRPSRWAPLHHPEGPNELSGFNSIVAIDPDDAGEISVVRDYVERLKTPLLIIGAAWSWKGQDICAPKQYNYQSFFEHAPKGTIELTLKGADHVQMLKDPEQFGYAICRVGEAETKYVQILSLKAVLGFFGEHLLGKPSLLQDLPKGLVRAHSFYRSELVQIYD